MTGATLTPPEPVAARPAVSVIVCAFTEDRWEDLRRSVNSVLGQTEAAAETILVIDHCPGLLERAQRDLAGVRILANRFGRGLSGGRNTGVAEARGDVVAFLDDDATASPAWIARLADRYADPVVLGVGGLVQPAWDAGRPAWFPPELDWVVGCSYLGMPEESGPVRNFIGANMSFRREVVTDLGGFSADLGRVGTVPLGCEETELCLRIGRAHAGGVLVYEPAAAVTHRVRAQRGSWSYLRARCYAEGLSKAQVARLAGVGRALSSEGSYVRSTIPRGVCRSLAGAARGRLSGLASAFALIWAVLVTGVGYATGRVAGLSPSGLRLREVPARVGRVLQRAGPALVPWAGLTVALVLWAAALAGTDVARLPAAGLGLVSVLPATFWVAAGLLTASFSWAVVRPVTRWPLLTAHLAALVAILHATPAVLYTTLRYSWAWKHVGVIDYIAHHGIDFSLGGILGPYQGWPGFFALNASLIKGSGLGSALSYANWVLPVNDLLWLGPILLIARCFTADKRLIWTAAWLFELANWVGQDYFSPQAFAYFLYLTVIALSLRWFWDPRSGPPPEPGNAAPAPESGRPAPRWPLVVCLLPLMAAIASSHQLTPFMLIAALGILAVFGQLRPRLLLPSAMAIITVGWLVYGAWPWLTANSSQLLQGLGLPWANTSAHLVGGGNVPSDQILVDWGARALSATVAILAVAGFIRYWRRHDARARRSWTRVALLAVAALPAAAFNSYGGEIIFRVFLFALPFMAVAAAATLFPSAGTGRPAWAGVALTAITVAMLAGYSLGNFGDEAMNYFTPQEVAASQWLYRSAPAGARVIGADSNFPWAFTHYDSYSYTFLDSTSSLSRAVLRAPVATVVRLMGPSRSPSSYLVLTRSQAAEIRLVGEWPPGAYSRFVRDLRNSGDFRVVYQNADATVLQLSRAAGGQPGVTAPPLHPGWKLP